MRLSTVRWDIYQVIQAWSGLTTREQDLLIQRYANHKTMDEMASLYGVSKQRIEQMEDVSLTTLKNVLDEKVPMEDVKLRVRRVLAQTGGEKK
jgi:DNA-directed RNA polymerase sigma subunit (sigma70/sigma32)